MTSKPPQSESIKSLLERYDPQAWLIHLGINIRKRSGDWWECDCPICGKEKKLHYNTAPGAEGQWSCKAAGCGKGGNAIGLAEQVKGVPRQEATLIFRRFMGQEIDEVGPKKRGRKPQEATGGTKSSSKNGKKDSRPADNEDAAIYQRLVDLTYLTDEDRASMKKKRGFSDETIDLFRFRSGGEYLNQVVAQLREEFTEEALVKSGVLVKVNNAITINSQLTDGRVLIPYIDEKGAIYHLRPHKLGFSGIASQLYCRLLLKDRPTHVILTEGEFKAAALYQWGIPALAEPGTPSFAGKNLDRMITLLNEFGVKKVTVIFDSEDKSNPAFPGFKPRPEDRYDTQFWAYITAQRLTNKGKFETNIAWLPESWQENGKVDFDSALAQGRSAKDIWKVIDSAVDHKEFLKNLDEEPQIILKKKAARQFTKEDVRREFNKYLIKRNLPNGVEIEVPISNFIINIKSSLFTPSGVIRNVEFVNTYNERSETFPLLPESMAGVGEFKKFCFSRGNYIFQGRSDELTKIWESEFLNNTGDMIYMPERIGRINKDLWLFGNMAIHKGKIYRPDNDGIIWVEKKGYKPSSLSVDQKGEAADATIPCLYDHLKTDPVLFVRDVATKIKQSIKDYGAYIAIGWAIATIFSQDIFQQHKCFPILFPQGLRESGKTTLMRWIQGFSGVEMDGIMIGESSQNSFARALSYYSSLSVWFDEYRNEKKVTDKDGFFRSAYNRQVSIKGTATAFQTRGYSIHGTVAISGEDIPLDNGLLTRCVVIELSEDRRDRAWYEWLNNNSEKFSAFTKYLLENYEQLLPKILENIDEFKKDLVGTGISDRTAINWAVCAATFHAVVMEDQEFIDWVFAACQEVKHSSENDHALNQFWSLVNVLLADRKINEKHIRKNGDELYVWLAGVYHPWAIEYKKRTGKEAFSLSAIQKYLKNEGYYKGNAQKKIDDVNRWVNVLDVNKVNQTIKEMLDYLERKEEVDSANSTSRYYDGQKSFYD
jgi:hypothetical protein